MVLAKDQLTRDTQVEMITMMDGVIGAHGVHAALPAAVANSSKHEPVRRQNVMELTGWLGHAIHILAKASGAAGVTGLPAPFPVDSVQELARANVFQWPGTRSLLTIVKVNPHSMIPAKCPIAIHSLDGANGVNGRSVIQMGRKYEPESA